MLQQNINIVTSADNLLRIYSWDTWLGGTMHIFENIFQFKSADNIYTKFNSETSTFGEDEYVPFYSQIFSLNENNKKYYLAVENGIYSTKDVSQSIKAFAIENNSLNDTLKLFKTRTEMLNKLEVNFDFFSVVDRPERPVRLIKYDPKKKIIYIPITLENGKISENFILYKFTGQYFEQILTKKNMKTKYSFISQIH